MAIRPGRRRLGRARAAAVALGCLAGLAAWRYWPWQQNYPVLLPPPAATPRQVAMAYVRSLDAYDTATAEALSAWSERANTAHWLHMTASITDITIDFVRYFPRAAEPYIVCTEYRYSAHWWTQDPSFPDGREYWCYYFIRHDGRWLIADDGLG